MVYFFWKLPRWMGGQKEDEMKAIVLVPASAVGLLALTVPVVGMLGSTPDGALIAPPPYTAHPTIPNPAPTPSAANSARLLSVCGTAVPTYPWMRSICQH